MNKKKLSYLMISACLCLAAAGLLKAAGQMENAPASSSTKAASALDYEFFKAKVQPIFVAKRPGHTRCFLCHADPGVHARFALVPLSPGAATWDETQTRENFELIKRVAFPGGKHFGSQTNAEWLLLKEFVMGEKAK